MSEENYGRSAKATENLLFLPVPAVNPGPQHRVAVPKSERGERAQVCARFTWASIAAAGRRARAVAR